MIRDYRKTDSVDTLAIHPKLLYSVPEKPPNETIGRTGDAFRYSFLNYPSLTRPAFDIIRQAENEEVAERARRLLSVIQEAVSVCRLRPFGLGVLPSLGAFIDEDGSAVIEWIFPDFRIGFGIEVDPADSGWYLVSNERFGGINAYGYLSPADVVGSIVSWLVSFASSNT